MVQKIKGKVKVVHSLPITTLSKVIFILGLRH